VVLPVIERTTFEVVKGHSFEALHAVVDRIATVWSKNCVQIYERYLVNCGTKLKSHIETLYNAVYVTSHALIGKSNVLLMPSRKRIEISHYLEI
jgi:hypothetical protein